MTRAEERAALDKAAVLLKMHGVECRILELPRHSLLRAKYRLEYGKIVRAVRMNRQNRAISYMKYSRAVSVHTIDELFEQINKIGARKNV